MNKIERFYLNLFSFCNQHIIQINKFYNYKEIILGFRLDMNHGLEIPDRVLRKTKFSFVEC